MGDLAKAENFRHIHQSRLSRDDLHMKREIIDGVEVYVPTKWEDLRNGDVVATMSEGVKVGQATLGDDSPRALDGEAGGATQ